KLPSRLARTESSIIGSVEQDAQPVEQARGFRQGKPGLFQTIFAGADQVARGLAKIRLAQVGVHELAALELGAAKARTSQAQIAKRGAPRDALRKVTSCQLGGDERGVVEL